MDRRTELANSISVGSDGWLFHRDNNTFEQLTQTKPFSPRSLTRWVRLLELRHYWHAAQNIKYYFFVAPEKHVVYAERLSPEYRISENRPVRQLLNRLNRNLSGPQLVYPIQTLVLRKNELQTFWAAGSHWNSFGAYLAYRELCETISRDLALPRVLEQDDFRLEVCRHSSDLGVRVDPEVLADEHLGVIRSPESVRVLHNRGNGRGAVTIYEHPDKSRPRAIFFRDSATSWLLPFLAESFSRLVVLSSTEVYYELVLAERPDIVVTEMIERYLDEPTETPHDLDCRSFEELCGCTLSTVTAAPSPGNNPLAAC
jgi:alginate O-acetyltransferase complex protein AlgJ